MTGKANPLRVTLARESRGHTQSSLALAIGVAQGTLSKVEHGQIDASDDLIDRLSTELNYPRSFFFGAITFRNLPISYYRKRARATATLLRTIRAKVNILRFQVERLLQSVDIPELVLPQVDLDRRKQSVEQIAAELRIRWHLPPGPIGNLTETLESAGIVVVRCDFGTRDVDAISLYVPEDGLPPMIFISYAAPGDRFRFSVAHELAHLVLHHHQALPEKDIEDEADRFASAFLMPRADVYAHLHRLDLARLGSLKPHWRVSMAALLERAHQLGRLTDGQRRYLWSQMSRHGYATQEPLPLPQEEPTLLREIVSFHRDSLGYSDRELSELVQLNSPEFKAQYATSGPTLRVIHPSPSRARHADLA